MQRILQIATGYMRPEWARPENSPSALVRLMCPLFSPLFVVIIHVIVILVLYIIIISVVFLLWVVMMILY